MKKFNRFKPAKFERGEGLFFTSDQHFNHANIIKYANRSFNNISEMNQTMINNWNNVVSKADTVFILGDFCFAPAVGWEKILKQLAGDKVLILGNHDYKNFHPNLYPYFIDVRDRMEIQIESQKIMLDHYPAVSYNGMNRGSWQFYGHIHEQKFEYATSLQYCVCVEQNQYTPISYREIEEIINYQIDNNLININKDKWDIIQDMK